MIPTLTSLHCPACYLPYNTENRRPFLDICTHTRCKACFKEAVGRPCEIDGCRSLITACSALNPGLLAVVREVGILRQEHLPPPPYGSLGAAADPLDAAPSVSANSPAPAPYGGFAAAQQSQFEQTPFSANSIVPDRQNEVSLWQFVNVSSQAAQAKLRDRSPGSFILSYTSRPLDDQRNPHITYRLNFVPKRGGPVQERLIKLVFLPKTNKPFIGMDDEIYDKVEISVWDGNRCVHQETRRTDRGPSGDSPVYSGFRTEVQPSEYERFGAYLNEGFWSDFSHLLGTIMDRGL